MRFTRLGLDRKNSLLLIGAIYILSLPVMAGEFSVEQICKAAIGTLMGQDPKIIKILKIDSGVIDLNYIRPADGTKWSYRCKLDGNKVIWAADKGRWRVGPDDEVITYGFVSGGIEVVDTYSDGSSSKETYTAMQLGK